MIESLAPIAGLVAVVVSAVSVSIAVSSYLKAAATAEDVERRLAEMTNDQPAEDIAISPQFDDSDTVEIKSNG